MIHRGTITYFNGSNTYSGGMYLVRGTIGLGIDSFSDQGTLFPARLAPARCS